MQIIGTGEHCILDTLEIHWPDANGTVSTFERVRANYVLQIHRTDGLEYLTMDEYLAGP